MLKFNPVNYLTFTPNGQDCLQSTFIISNPSNNCSAPFKIKSTKPELFNVRPHIGVILPLQQVQVTITTAYKNGSEFAREVAQEHKFRVEYSMLERAPISINDALAKITDENKQTHKFYISTPDGRANDVPEGRSNLSNRHSYRSVRDSALPQLSSRHQHLLGGSEERFDYLKGEIDRLEKERSEVIMSQSAGRRINLLTALLVLLFMIVVGNLTAKVVFPHKAPTRARRQKREYKYWGLEKWWAQQQPEEEERPWWKFWK